MSQNLRILNQQFKDKGIVRPPVVTPTSETTREQRNRFDALASTGTETEENKENFETTSVGSNSDPQQQTVEIEDIELVIFDDMTTTKKNTHGDLKRLIENHKQANNEINVTMQPHKNPTITKVRTVQCILARILAKVTCLRVEGGHVWLIEEREGYKKQIKANASTYQNPTVPKLPTWQENVDNV